MTISSKCATIYLYTDVMTAFANKRHMPLIASHSKAVCAYAPAKRQIRS